MIKSSKVITLIKIHLSRLLGERRMSQADLSRKTKIRASTINAYYNEYIKRMNRDDLDKMCKILDCKLNELIEYIPDKKVNE
jgi:putative transcriptional regulator